MQIQDASRQTIDVAAEWHRRKMVRIIINRGKSDERDLVLDSEAAKSLVQELTEAL